MIPKLIDAENNNILFAVIAFFPLLETFIVIMRPVETKSSIRVAVSLFSLGNARTQLKWEKSIYYIAQHLLKAGLVCYLFVLVAKRHS